MSHIDAGSTSLAFSLQHAKNEQTGESTRYLDLLKDCLAASLYNESAWQVLQPSGNFFRRQVIKQFAKRKKLVVHVNPFDKEKRDEGADWPMFGYTMVGRKRLDNVEFCIRDIVQRDVEGDIVETGTWRGGCCIFMRALLRELGDDRSIWACDSFEGMPKPKHSKDEVDLSSYNYLAVSLEQVRENFRRFGLLDEHVRFLKGWFCDTLPSAPIKKISVLRLDGDLYHSTMDVLANLYHKVSPSGYVIVDDYGSWPECKRAVQDFLNAQNIQVQIVPIDDGGVFWQVA